MAELIGMESPRVILSSDPKSGRLAQLGEHLLYTQGVGGSNPSPPIRRARSTC